MKYVDTSAVLRGLFMEPGPAVRFDAGDRAVSSELLEVEAFRAVDRERLLGNLDDPWFSCDRFHCISQSADGDTPASCDPPHR